MTDIDPNPVAALPDRFSTSKQTVYTRMEALGIAPIKQGKRAYIHLDQLRQLDALHDHLAAGGHLQDFGEHLTRPPSQVDSLDSSNPSTPQTPLAPLERLVNAAESLTGALMDITAADRDRNNLEVDRRVPGWNVGASACHKGCLRSIEFRCEK